MQGRVSNSYVWSTKPVLSPWSAKWSFTTVLGRTIFAPELLSPKPGVTEVPLKPVFQWSAIAGAESYELLVSTDASFADPLIVKTGDYALPATAWQSDISLDYNTTYYWKVRARGYNSYSAWSAVGAFTTELPPPESPPSEPPSPESSPESSEPLPPPELPLEPSPPPELLSEPSPPEPSQLTVQLVVPNWAIYLVVALLATTVLLMITLLALVVGIRRF